MNELALKLKLSEVLPQLNERQRRIITAAEAKAHGRGGISLLSRVTGFCRETIYRGMRDLEAKVITDRIRDEGGGRKRITEKIPRIEERLQELLDPDTRGDPESLLRWTCKSVRKLEAELHRIGISVSYKTIGNILHELQYSLQSNRKRSDGKADHPDRDLQFRHINAKGKAFLRNNEPLISVDTNKKELVGKYKNNGRDWRPKGNPIDVLTHDFPDPDVSKAVPYGVHDIGANAGWVNVGIDGDTAEFAVESIRQWWIRMGRKRYPDAHRLMICADSGGSNGYRSHLWKRELHKFAEKNNLSLHVCHFPPGTSKWNKVEHRLFSFISMNWRGGPLTDYQTIVNLIAATTTDTGLTVKVRLDKNEYRRGIKISKGEMSDLAIKPDKFHGEWNYQVR